MSKLFETLDKIQHQEEEQALPYESAKLVASSQRSRLPFLVIAVVIAGFIVVYQNWSGEKVVPVSRSANKLLVAQNLVAASPMQPVVADLQVTPQDLSAAEAAESYNRIGVEYARKGQFWEAIFYFEKAQSSAPEMIEPYINQGAVLLNLKLANPAKKILLKAYDLDSHNMALWETINNARKSELVTVEFVQSLAEGDRG